MAKKLKVRKVVNQVEEESVIDESELTEDEIVEEEIDTDDETEVEVDSEDEAEDEVPSTEEGEGDGPKVSIQGENQVDGSSSLGDIADKLLEGASEDLEDLEQDLITLIHTVKTGTLILAHRTYEIVDHEVKILAEDFQACIHHGLVQKE